MLHNAPLKENDKKKQHHKNNCEIITTRFIFSYLALSFAAGVVDELNRHGVAAAQTSVKVDSLLLWWGQSSEKQIVVEVSQIITTQSQPRCSLTGTQRQVLEAQRTLKRAHI